MSSISVSPSGDRIAFAEHPVAGDNRGDICVVDASGKKTTLAAGWEDLGQTAWSPDGREIWFSGSMQGIDQSMFAVTLSGSNTAAADRRRQPEPAGCVTRRPRHRLERRPPHVDDRQSARRNRREGPRVDGLLLAGRSSPKTDGSSSSASRAWRGTGIRGLPSGHRRVAGRPARQRGRAFVVARRTMGNRNGSCHAHADAAADGNGPASRDPEPRNHRLFVGGLLPRRQADRVRRHGQGRRHCGVMCRTWTVAHRGRSRRTAPRLAVIPSHRTANGWRRVTRVRCGCSRWTAVSRRSSLPVNVRMLRSGGTRTARDLCPKRQDAGAHLCD